MEQRVSGKRLTETLSGRLAAVLLSVTWLVSMGAVDTNAYSVYPVLLALGGVMLLSLSAMLSGGRAVRLSWMAWLMLGVGGYFFVRCLCSYSVVEAWLESSHIVSCAVFYIAGVYGAQSRNGRLLMTVLAVAMLLNIVYFFWEPAREGLMRWTGRPEVGLAGKNSNPTGLLVYKNHTCAFLMLGGSALVGCALWCARSVWGKTVCFLLALVTLIVAFSCHSRACYLMSPVLVVMGWFLHISRRVHEGGRLGVKSLLISFALLVGVLIVLVELIWGGGLEYIVSIDSHLRYKVWECVFRVALSAPAWGCGTMGAHWETLGAFNEWSTANMAHNEYLQVWADYGVIGLLLMVGLLVSHTVVAIRALGSAILTPLHRGLISCALMVMWGGAVASLADFMMHSYPMVTLVAFCCGVLASPVATQPYGGRHREGAEQPVNPVRVQGSVGKGILALLACAVMGFVGWQTGNLREAWYAQWQYDYLSAAGRDDDARKRHDLIAQVMQRYPDSTLADEYFTLPLYKDSLDQQEEVLRAAISGNPRQGYMITMLADLLTRRGRYEETEVLLRRYYPQEGWPVQMTRNWPLYYYNNLLNWSRREMRGGNVAMGLSMGEYVINMRPKMYHMVYAPYGRFSRYWKSDGPRYRKGLDDLYRSLKHEVELLRRLGVQKDDSWMSAMEPGGKTALYPGWGLYSPSDDKSRN